MTPAPPRPAEAWAQARERGNSFWVGLGFALVRGLGWRFGRLLLLPITAWFLASTPAARAASREYLGRALGRRATVADVARHIHAFAVSILDTPFLLADRAERFRIEVAGLDHLMRALEAGRGCLLLGSHLGSYEVLRHFARGCPVPVRPMMYRRNAGVLSGLLDRLDPLQRERVIEIGPPESLLRAREALARGEIVGILGDREPAGGRVATVPFLGAPAAFPTGPMLLIAALGAPVVSFRAVCVGRRRYAVTFAPFADCVAPSRPDRSRDVTAAVARFAAFVEAGCRAHPHQWFNFFSFWTGAADATDTQSEAPAPVGVGGHGGSGSDLPPRRRAA